MNDLNISVDTKSGVPLYIQIREQLKEAIESGRLAVNGQLYTIRELAVILKINPNTVSRAYRELEREGYIETQQGRGTFVIREPTWPESETDQVIMAELRDCFEHLEAQHLIGLERLNKMAILAIYQLTAARGKGENDHE